MTNRIRHTLIGFFFVSSLIVVAFSTVRYHAAQNMTTYYFAAFKNAAGVSKGTPVYLSGIKVGEVAAVFMDRGLATAKIAVQRNLKIPLDSMLQIETFTLFSPKAVTISPGFEETMLPPMGYFRSVQNSIDFAGLVKAYINNRAHKKIQGERDE